jgi:DNA-directed RNA polymerase subunit RPC12/RpoP
VSKLACRTCGRQVFVAVPVEALHADDRRCPRCGLRLDPERRDADRRRWDRRRNRPVDPGPPAATGERRAQERRKRQRRR